jgi:hypothetical protein
LAVPAVKSFMRGNVPRNELGFVAWLPASLMT